MTLHPWGKAFFFFPAAVNWSSRFFSAGQTFPGPSSERVWRKQSQLVGILTVTSRKAIEANTLTHQPTYIQLRTNKVTVNNPQAIRSRLCLHHFCSLFLFSFPYSFWFLAAGLLTPTLRKLGLTLASPSYTTSLTSHDRYDSFCPVPSPAQLGSQEESDENTAERPPVQQFDAATPPTLSMDSPKYPMSDGAMAELKSDTTPPAFLVPCVESWPCARPKGW